jgi:hypothetical protein
MSNVPKKGGSYENGCRLFAFTAFFIPPPSRKYFDIS